MSAHLREAWARRIGSTQKVYRGLGLSYFDHDPSDAEVLAGLRGIPASDLAMAEANDWPIYGQHWTSDPEVARDFALRRANNNPPHAQSRTNTTRTYWGVVLEATVNDDPGPGMERFWTEREVRPTRSQVTDVVAHLHVRRPTETLRQNRLQDTYVRSIPVPEATWRHASVR